MAVTAAKVDAVAYETIVGRKGGLPCLAPMSEIAGRMSIQEGAKYLERPFGGRGVLLGGVPGVKRGNVVILGAGKVGSNAAMMAMGLNANVTITDVNLDRLAQLDEEFGSKLTTLYSTDANIREAIKDADLVIGSVLLPGKATPKLLRRGHLALMKPGAVIVDVAIDQGGCCETSHATTHADPIFMVDGIVHYCVANIPGAVSNTSTQALVNRTLPYGLKLAGMGVEAACQGDKGLMLGVSDTEFGPNLSTTRGMIVTILYRMDGSPAAGSSAFADVAPGAYYASAVAWASANGIVTGYEDGSFGPEDPITREQMAAFLFRYARYKGLDVSAQANLSGYTDAGRISPYAVEPLRWANALGLITGTTADTISPTGSATREQAAVILTRFIRNTSQG